MLVERAKIMKRANEQTGDGDQHCYSVAGPDLLMVRVRRIIERTVFIHDLRFLLSKVIASHGVLPANDVSELSM